MATTSQSIMKQFKKNVKELLPYDRRRYIEPLSDDFYSATRWCGVSFQLENVEENIDLTEPVKIFRRLLENIILELDNGSFWIINHEFMDVSWFPDMDDNLISLRTFFKQNNVQNTFKGALVLMKDELLKLSEDLILYPYILSYKNLDISHNDLQFIIKITNHLTIDLLSTDKELLRKVVNENSLKIFIIKQYRGTSLW